MLQMSDTQKFPLQKFIKQKQGTYHKWEEDRGLTERFNHPKSNQTSQLDNSEQVYFFEGNLEWKHQMLL